MCKTTISMLNIWPQGKSCFLTFTFKVAESSDWLALHLSFSLSLRIIVENLLWSSWSHAEVGCSDGPPVMLLMKPGCSVWLSQTDIVLSVTLRDSHVTNRSLRQIPPWGTAEPMALSRLTGKPISFHTVRYNLVKVTLGCLIIPVSPLLPALYFYLTYRKTNK